MAATIWTGAVSFGLVNIPVTVRPAEARKELSFTMLDRRDMGRIGYRKVNKATGEEVPGTEIVKAYEYDDDRFVVVEEADLKRASPEKTQRIEIEAFVDLREIDPAFFEKPYYLEPTAKSDKAYALLREAMARTGKAGIASVVIKARQYVAAVVPRGEVLLLELLRYGSELRDPADLHLPAKEPKKLKISEAELKTAERLIGDLAGHWDPSRYKDEYRAELLAFIEKKAKAGKTEAAAPEPKAARLEPPTDIMALLKKSVAQAEAAAGKGRGRYVH
jgi:DNA end-binding protein Ku